MNHTYGGVYLVSTQRLYEAVNTIDITTNATRGLVIVNILPNQADNNNSDATTTNSNNVKLEMDIV